MNFIYRNSMIDIFFSKDKYVLSDYGSPLSTIDAENYIWMNLLNPAPNEEEILKQIVELNSNLEIAIKSSNDKPIFVLGLFAPKLFSPLIYGKQRALEAICKFNYNLLELSGKQENIFYLDPNHLIGHLGEDYFSSKFYFSSGSIISPTCSNKFQLWLNDVESIISNKRKKLIILDLDNTLWGGVLGEDGYNGVQIGNVYPGNVYTYLQRKILELSSLGVILTICSKNNYDDVKEGFQKNTNMLLKLDDFSIIKANWNDKADNIRDIIKEINIGEDACIFIDDNPLERDLVRSSFSDLTVPDFPKKQYDIPEFIDKLSFKYFSSKNITQEDIEKKNQYQIKLRADIDKRSISSKDKFLKSLCLKGYVINNVDMHILRISQMTQKTNQFNLTTMRFEENDIKKMIHCREYIFPLQIKDKYGDHGITGLIIASKTSNPDHVDLSIFLMSCRILGRDIEFEFLKWCLCKLSKEGISKVTARYIKTKKNIQVESFYENAGFKLISQDSEEKKYELVINKKWLKENTIKNKYIKIIEVTND